MEERLKRELDDLSARGLLRSLKEPAGIDFSSNDYLGLSKDTRLRQSFADSVLHSGVGSTGSRLLRGESESFRKVEGEFAVWKGTEASLYFATGYQANVGILQTLLKKEDMVFSDELNHASIIDGIRLGNAEKRVFPHLDTAALEKLLETEKCNGARFVITESLFSMDGDTAPLDVIAQICRRDGAHLIVDEAHAVGLFGKKGSGLIEEFGIPDDVFLSINTAGKALGVSGAFAAGSGVLIEYLINRCRSFIFSTAPVPAVGDALSTSIAIIQNEPELRENLFATCGEFARALAANGIGTRDFESHIVPVIIGDSAEAVRIAGKMQDKGFDVRAIRPPTVKEGTARLRVSLNTKLSKTDLLDFAKCLSEELQST